MEHAFIDEIDKTYGRRFALDFEMNVAKFFNEKNIHALPNLADQIFISLQLLEKIDKHNLLVKSFVTLWDLVRREWVRKGLGAIVKNAAFTFEEFLNIMKEYEYRLNILSRSTDYIEDIADRTGDLIRTGTFDRAGIIKEFFRYDLFNNIQIEDAILKMLLENKTGDEILIHRFVDFCKFVVEFRLFQIKLYTSVEDILKTITDLFRSYFDSNLELAGKYNSRIRMWKNLTTFGSLMGPLIKEKFRMLGFVEIYSDASTLVQLLYGLDINRDGYNRYHDSWKKAYEIKYGIKPAQLDINDDISELVYPAPLNDEFSREFLSINKIIFDPNNFEETFKRLKKLDDEQLNTVSDYSSNLINQVRVNYLKSIEVSSSSQYYSLLIKFLLKEYDEYKKCFINTNKYPLSQSLENRFLSYLVRYYCPNYELFLKKYWLPRLIKILSRPPEDDPCTNCFMHFNSTLYFYMINDENNSKDEILKIIEDASEHPKTLQNGCIFTNYLIPKAHVDIEVVDADTVWADKILEKEWENVVGKLTESSKFLENNNAVHYVTMETPLNFSDGTPLSIQTSMCSAAILNCFNDEDVMTLDKFIKTLKITKSQSKRLFSCLNKLIGMKLLLKGKSGMTFNYNFDCSTINSNPLRI